VLSGGPTSVLDLKNCAQVGITMLCLYFDNFMPIMACDVWVAVRQPFVKRMYDMTTSGQMFCGCRPKDVEQLSGWF